MKWMKLNFLTSLLYRLLLIQSAKPNYLSAVFGHYDIQSHQNHLNANLNMAVNYQNLEKFSSTSDDSNSCLDDPSIYPYIQELFEYNSLLNAYDNVDCDAKESRKNLLLTDEPDTLMEDIKQLEANKPCVYRPLSQTMISTNSLSYAVNDSSDIQFYIQHDLLKIRSAYLLHYHQACKMAEGGEFVGNLNFALPLKEANFPDCNSLPIIQKHLEIVSSRILSYYIERSSSSLAIPHPLYILVLQEIDQLPYQLGRESILQCRIDNINYIVRGRSGMKFLLHELSSRIIDGLLGNRSIINTKCDIYATSNSAGTNSVVSTITFANLIDELKKTETMLTSNETSYRNCGNTNYELFNLGLDTEKKIPPNTNITLCCYEDNDTPLGCSIFSNNYRFLVTKFVDKYRREKYLPLCIQTVNEAIQSTTNHSLNKVRHKREKKQTNLLNCEQHPFVIDSFDKTKTKINLKFTPFIEKIMKTENDTLCFYFRKEMLSHIYLEQMSFDNGLAMYSKSDNECLLNGKRRKTEAALQLTYYKKLRRFARRRNEMTCPSSKKGSTILFTHSRDEGKICIKLGLSYLIDHFTLLTKRMLQSNSAFKNAAYEESDLSRISATKIPLDIFFSYLSEEDIIELEKDITGPSFILESDNRMKKACINYLLAVLYYKKADYLQKTVHENETVIPQQVQLVIDYSNKAIEKFEMHTELLKNLGKFSDYEFLLYNLQHDMYEKLGNKNKTEHYSLLINNFSRKSRMCSERGRVSRSVAIVSSADSESVRVMDNSTICNIPLRKYPFKLSVLDSSQNIYFKESMLLIEDCNEKAFESLDSAYKGGSPKFESQFSKDCPYVSSSSAINFFQEKMNEKINSDECSNNRWLLN